MLIRRPVLDAIAAGTVTVAFRRWDRPRVLVGTRLRTAVGVVEITAVDAVDDTSLTEDDARRSGHRDLAHLRKDPAVRKEGPRRDGTLYRVTLRPAGEDPRIALREDADLSAADHAALTARLERMDRAAADGPWTATVLGLIAANPGVRAPDLAERLGRETAPFKRDVRKLKELGLTESLPVGYRLSPRGVAYRAATTTP